MTEYYLNLGCGLQHKQSTENKTWVNLDNDLRTKPQVLRDVKRGLPFNTGIFSVVYASHFLEHFGGEDFVFIMNEIYRVLKPGGVLQLLSPYYKFHGAWVDPHHKMFFNEHSFEPYWYPSNSSIAMGVEGFYEPVSLQVAEEMEIRVTMKKIGWEQLKEYVDRIGKNNQPPKWENVVSKDFKEVT